MSKYDHLSKEQLIALLEKRDRTRKLGLVWEHNELEVENALNDDFVLMDLLPEWSCGQTPYRNLLIEGDNFDALRYLRMTFQGRVKCIYIDPPYNTGNKDFIYNDRFVDQDDIYRHSVWLEYLFVRLTLVKDLLRDDGVILVSINDDNQALLDMLMRQVFTEGMRVGSLVWRSRAGSNDIKGAGVSINQEYVLVYANPKFSMNGLDRTFAAYKNPDKDPDGAWRMFPMECNKTFVERPNLYYPIHDAANDVWYPANPDQVWRWSLERTHAAIKAGEITFPCRGWMAFDNKNELIAAIREKRVPSSTNGTSFLFEDMPDLDFWVGKKIGIGKPQRKKYASEFGDSRTPFNSFILPNSEIIEDEISVGGADEGARALRSIMGKNVFSYPKPPSLIRLLIEQCTSNNGSDIVLDFFAGSGTTAQAVLEQNHIDNGNRQFILVSSTEKTDKEPEKNVCRDVCAQRLRRVIEGYSVGKQNVTGLGGSFAYLQAVKIAQSHLQTDIRHDQIWFALQLLTFDAVEPFDADKTIHCVETDQHRMLYLQQSTPDIIEQANTLLQGDTKPTTLYTWQRNGVMQRIPFEYVTVEQIPDYLIERFAKGQGLRLFPGSWRKPAALSVPSF
ncbi:MAG: site-specific DNA-methyltransferase [Candidatus Thiothrix sulfatifontis]|nr:MAG: site-specific DNA-methyltransferase [Candidatus Thiothrix sulfatifontis]